MTRGKALVYGLNLSNAAGNSLSGSLLAQLNDCNASHQKVSAVVDTNEVGSYNYSLSYGGNYNHENLACSTSAKGFVIDKDTCAGKGPGSLVRAPGLPRAFRRRSAHREKKKVNLPPSPASHIAPLFSPANY